MFVDVVDEAGLDRQRGVGQVEGTAMVRARSDNHGRQVAYVSFLQRGIHPRKPTPAKVEMLEDIHEFAWDPVSAPDAATRG